MADIVNTEIPKEDMVAPSKELSKEEEPSKKRSAGGSKVLSVVYNVFKKVAVVGSVYFVGYMQWSFAWLLLPMALSLARQQWQEEADYKRNITKLAATHSEKDIILAKLNDLPAWVFFPDIERAEWLNRIVAQVWPNVNHFTRNLLKKKIEPTVAKKLTKMKLHGFQFDRLILGSISPRIGGVKVYDKNVPRNEIMMDIDLFYAGDCDISFSVSGIRGGIKDLQIHGMLRVIMKPLIDSIPLVGGLQVFFLNNPSIDFNLVGIADILDMPGFSDILRRCIVEQVADMMVLPNKLPIKLSDDVPSRDLSMPEPEGVLRIHVVEAKDLMKKDISVLGIGKSDPYALINVGATQFRTQVIDNNINPKWDYWCEIIVSYTAGQSLHLEIFDKDDNSKDEKLGRCTIDIHTIVKKRTLDTWLVLEQAKHGMVHLRLTWFTLTPDASHLNSAIIETQLLRVSGMSTAILCLYIDSCKNLPNARPQSKPDSYLVVSVGKRSENSGVQMRVADPVFDIGYSFLVADPQSDTLHITVMDQKTGHQLGIFTYNISNLLEEPKLSSDLQPYNLQKAGPDTKIYLSMVLRILKYEPPLLMSQASQEEDNALLDLSGEHLAHQDTQKIKSDEYVKKTTKQNSVGETDPANLPPKDVALPEALNKNSVELDTVIKEAVSTTSAVPLMKKTPPSSPKLVHRHSNVTSSAGEAGLGRIQLTLRYSVQRQRLVVVVHKIANIPLKDPSNIPDPYVKLYLLPSRSKDSKRKTAVMKDNCNPIYDETFEYVMSQGEVHSQELEVTVASQKGFFSGGSPVIGQVVINLAERELSQAQTWWFDLLPEAARD